MHRRHVSIYGPASQRVPGALSEWSERRGIRIVDTVGPRNSWKQKDHTYDHFGLRSSAGDSHPWRPDGNEILSARLDAGLVCVPWICRHPSKMAHEAAELAWMAWKIQSRNLRLKLSAVSS